MKTTVPLPIGGNHYDARPEGTTDANMKAKVEYGLTKDPEWRSGRRGPVRRWAETRFRLYPNRQDAPCCAGEMRSRLCLNRHTALRNHEVSAEESCRAGEMRYRLCLNEYE